ncbi:hypothetical protein RF11_06012 [Thelohanellus kitauei]|uniref:Reverse transcriptase domain-containing protein n=1 Tax=Thelohanellus kitauei TaxID=669202 RepID=A0A0C2MTT1_THEKT|nr:hypothetical protein RF11_06012 [Thelohanellus kitauei]
MDDSIVSGASFDDHVSTLKNVLFILEQTLFKKYVTYLGRIISYEGMWPESLRVLANIKLPKPSNIAELECFIGSVNFLIKIYSELCDYNRPFEFIETKNANSNVLSRLPCGYDSKFDQKFSQLIISIKVINIPINENKIGIKTIKDEILRQISSNVMSEWPKIQMNSPLFWFYINREHLYIEADCRITNRSFLHVIIQSLHAEMIQLIHKGHIGSVLCSL